MGTIKESILADLDRTKISETTLLDFRSPTIMDKDVVCSQIDQDEFKAFVEEQGENDLNMSVRLIDYIMAKELYKSVRVCNLTNIKAQSLTIA